MQSFWHELMMKTGDQKDEHLDDDTSGIIPNQRLNLKKRRWKIILSNMVSERTHLWEISFKLIPQKMQQNYNVDKFNATVVPKFKMLHCLEKMQESCNKHWKVWEETALRVIPNSPKPKMELSNGHVFVWLNALGLADHNVLKGTQTLKTAAAPTGF